MSPVSARFGRVLRRLARAPFFTAVAVVTLGVGIGANAAIFSVVNGVLLKPLPYADPERLVAVWHTAPGINIPLLNQGPANYFVYRQESRTFEDFGLWNTTSLTVTGLGEPERVPAIRVTDGVLGLLGVPPLVGRSFTREDDAPGAPPRVILTHGFWQRKFGGDSSVIGRTLTVDSLPYEVIGVLPEGFRFLDRSPQLLVTMRLNPAEIFVGNFSYMGLARLKPGATIAQANEDVARMLPLTIERFPMPAGFTRQMFDDAKIGPLVRPLAADVIGDVGQTLWILLATVGIVLLIACANVANLFLVRAEGRQQELAIHAALGASWRRITWELLSESLTLAALGGALGLGLASAAVRTLGAIAPDGLPRIADITVDLTVVLFTVAISALAGLLFGLLPVVKFARPQLANALKEGGRLSSAGRSRHRARNTLVVAEIALAVVLLIASGLMIRTFQAMRQVDPGFTRPEEVLTVRVSIPSSVVRDPEQTARTQEAIAARIAQVPGVTSVGVTSAVPMDGNDTWDPLFLEDFPVPEGRIPAIRRYKWIGAGYFETMGNRLVAGRPLDWRDAYTRAPVVVVSENFAREFWKEPARALGRRVRNTPNGPWREIVGVAGDERDQGLTRPAPTTVYWPAMVDRLWSDEVMVQRAMAYVIRNDRGKSPTLLKEIQQAVWAVNPNLPVANVRTLEEIQSRSMAQTSFALVMLAIAAGVALLLGVVGIYGVISYIATQRTREIGIRMALGAAQRDVSRLFLRHGVVLAACGIVLGLAGAAALTRFMETLLFGVQPLDWVTYAAVAAGLGLTALVASYLPAARAARVDPAVALRFEV
ncbi:MAG TPA: ABC transporter permease [Vicinamibacterales bacterium]|nr:ABC transporter permease [Vicinamibacterales bacterium]